MGDTPKSSAQSADLTREQIEQRRENLNALCHDPEFDILCGMALRAARPPLSEKRVMEIALKHRCKPGVTGANNIADAIKEAISESAAQPVNTERDGKDDGMCPNCVTPWKCNGPRFDEPGEAELWAKAKAISAQFPFAPFDPSQAAQPASEAVAWLWKTEEGTSLSWIDVDGKCVPLYTAPPTTAQTIAECAKVCEEIGASMTIHNFSIPETGKRAARWCAAAIRAISPTTDGGKW